MNPNVSDKVSQFFSKYPQRTYSKGQMLIFEGEEPKYVFYIVSGRVREYDVSYRGDEVIVNIFKPPAFFPMSWAINKTGNQYFYKAEDDVTVHITPSEDAVTFLKDNPDVAFDLLSRLYRGLDGLLGRIVHLMSGTARSRILYEIIVECKRFGKAGGEGRYILKVKEVDLAARTGLTRETVSREIKKMKAVKLITVDHGTISIENLEALENQLGSTI